MQSIRCGTLILGFLFVIGGLLLLGGAVGVLPIRGGQVCGLFLALALIGAGLWTIVAIWTAQRTGAPLAQRTFGDQRLSLTDKTFTSRSVGTWIGDTRIDLSRAMFPEGESTLTVESWVGDIRVRVPLDLAVRARGRVVLVGKLDLLGTHREGLSLDLIASSRDYEQSPRRLFVDASTIIGEVRVTRAESGRR